MRKITRAIATLAFIGWVGSTSAGPISGADTVLIDGKYWAQVDLFTELSWNDIEAVCPSGTCLNNSALHGNDMSGWTWASIADLNALFNSYIGQEVMSGLDWYAEYDSTWAPEFLSDFRFTDYYDGLSSGERIFGWTSDSSSFGYAAGLIDYDSPSNPDGASTSNLTSKTYTGEETGGWFYVEVPGPPILWLFGVALASLGWTRRRKA